MRVILLRQQWTCVRCAFGEGGSKRIMAGVLFGVVQRAMRHSSPETKRHYQLGMVDQVREGIERANEQAYQGEDKLLRFYYGQAKTEKEAGQAS